MAADKTTVELPTIDNQALIQQLNAAISPLPIIKPLLAEIKQQCHKYFRQTLDATTLVAHRSGLMDQILSCLWEYSGFNTQLKSDTTDTGNIALIAVGGYGRGELQPHSDIDLLIVLKDEAAFDQHKEALQSFITLLWDIKLDIGHSVRTLDECVSEATKDLTIITNMMEARTLAGNQLLLQQLEEKTDSRVIWSGPDFFAAKWEELNKRHAKHEDTEYNLEPNVKNSPGTLRDIQTINWMAMRHFGHDELEELRQYKFLTQFELEQYQRSTQFLWQLRYALHMVTNREEDRLLFDLQKDIAEILGFRDDEEMLGVEHMMLQFYRHQLALTELTDILLFHIKDDIFGGCGKDVIEKIDDDLFICNGHIHLSDSKRIAEKPELLLRIFIEFAKRDNIEGMHSSTIRAIHDNRELIDQEFRENPLHNDLFMQFLRNNLRISSTLKRMMRYGILGRYIPDFGSIIGHMQYDLFHIYTVDEHSLRMVQMLRRYRHEDEKEHFPVAHSALKKIKRKEILYITAILHDAGKMHRGKHEIAGAEIAKNFCKQHKLSQYDADMAEWLVRNHLLMSQASQRIDINNPEDIHQFALEVGDLDHLNHLFLISVADIYTTNPKLWTGWRAEQMRTLYYNTKQAFRRGLNNEMGKDQLISAIQYEAIYELEKLGIEETRTREIWAEPGDDYFLREGTDNIIWHTQLIAQHGGSEAPVIAIRETSDTDVEGATQIFIFMKDHPDLFAVTTATLDQLNLSIQDARIMTSNNKNAVDTYIVLDENGDSIGNDMPRIEQIKQTLTKALTTPEEYNTVIQRRTSRQLKHFQLPTQVTLSNDPIMKRTLVEVTASDRPGLLARMGEFFMTHDLLMHSAKIMTEGECISDIFYISDSDDNPISDPELCIRIQEGICEALDQQVEAQQQI
ncbi:MAG TPA: [protein-PII] uridylyltransferase [Oceanospirillales bacterium]|nr:[protein-PII] uridylyltransferase [Oleispira sp.]HCM05122.1 [protein-PII] uridylyltransferase [Oceanospirillales bacterium]|tara:strand:+ start:6775 stop:9501 length:2727 start_codon:yes stop_codon:yes gene_type:complete